MNITVPRDELLAALCATRRAASDDITRPQLCAIEVRVHADRVTVVGTDGHRLHVWSAQWTVDRTIDPGLDHALLSPEAVAAMVAALRASRDVMVTLRLNGVLALSVHDIRFAGVDANYPNWQQVMPKPDRTGKLKGGKIGVCADYLASVCAAFNDCKAANGIKRNSRVRTVMSFAGALDQIEITSPVDVPQLTCVIMPVRL